MATGKAGKVAAGKKPLTAAQAAGAMLSVYVVIYVLLSLNGAFSDRPVSSGTRFYQLGVPMHDVYLWKPKGVTLLPFDRNALGVLYYPLITIDRMCWHRNLSVFDPRLPLRSAPQGWWWW